MSALSMQELESDLSVQARISTQTRVLLETTALKRIGARQRAKDRGPEPLVSLKLPGGVSAVAAHMQDANRGVRRGFRLTTEKKVVAAMKKARGQS